MSTTAQRPTAEAWPEGVIARYLTVGGATVDTVDDSADSTRSICTGCGGDRLSTYNLLDCATREEMREDARRQARRWSQEHAERCRAMPNPDGA